MKYSLRSLMIAAMVGPPLLAGGIWLCAYGTDGLVVAAFVILWSLAILGCWLLDSPPKDNRSPRE
ncbi:MAG: hypothetical protein K8R36_24815 [Planctomycetales bacterium]|nr:hypothetical protein [Planctomycetales bacterium]